MTERNALISAIIGAAVMSALGIGFALLTESEAILLDGIFSGISLMMAMITLKVASLVGASDDEHFQFGYAHFVPLINVIKSLLMVTLCSFALVSAVSALFTGGRPLNVGSAVIYGVLSTGAGIVLAMYLWKAAKNTGSALVELDARGALIDMFMSAAVLASFVGGWFLARTEYAEYLVYVDPALVTLLCIISLPVPLKLLFANLREVLLAAPDQQLQDQILERLSAAFGELDVADCRIRMIKLGNVMNVLVHVQPSDPGDMPPLDRVDGMTRRFKQSLAGLGLRGAADIVFVADIRLAD